MAAKKKVIVRQVFAEDLVREFRLIRTAIRTHPLISFDTEFPGTIHKQDKQSIQLADYSINYQFMKANVDALNIIQLGLTLSDVEGNLPDFGTSNCYIWEFNFRDFDIYQHPHDNDSIELLKRQGIDFEKNREEGIKSKDFAVKVLTSGLVFNSCWATWVTFHGAYDFGFLVKIMTQQQLPDDFSTFMAQVIYFFGYNVFDIKQSLRCLGVHGGLEKVAEVLNVARVAGKSHQAGSDSLLTLDCCMELKKKGVFESYPLSKVLAPLALYGLVSNLNHLPMVYHGIRAVEGFEIHPYWKDSGIIVYPYYGKHGVEEVERLEIRPYWKNACSSMAWGSLSASSPSIVSWN